MTRTRPIRSVALALLAGLTIPSSAGEPEKDHPVRVTVVVILASTDNNVVDRKLSSLAKEMEKRQSELVGFQMSQVLQKSVPVGRSHSFDLGNNQTLKVTIDQPKGKDGRAGLTLTTTAGGEVSYTCACDKFFPLVTEHKTRCGRTLMVAVGAKPCTGKGP